MASCGYSVGGTDVWVSAVALQLDALELASYPAPQEIHLPVCLGTAGPDLYSGFSPGLEKYFL